MISVKRLKYCANGEWKGSKTEQYTLVTNSSTGEIMAEVPCCTPDEINEAIESAKDAYPLWSGLPVTKRVEIMFRFRVVVEKHVDELSTLVAMELGKNMDEARGDVIKVIEAVELACASPLLVQGDSLMNVADGFDTAGMVGINVGIPVPISVFPFSGHKNSFFGDLHVLGKDGIAFYTEAKCITSRWFNEQVDNRVRSTWEGTITRI